MEVAEYLTKHMDIRARMVAARYSNISDPKVTVSFMIEGLKDNPETAQTGLTFFSTKPSTWQEFASQFNMIYKYIHSSTQNLGTYAKLFPGDQRYSSNRSSKPTHLPRHLQPNFQPCRRHLALGNPNPRHKDQECRDPNHHRNRRHQQRSQQPGPQARAVNVASHAAQDHTPPYLHYDPAEQDQNGKLILESAAHPTHIPIPVPSMQRIMTPLHTRTATNYEFPCTHESKTTFQTSNKDKITLDAVCAPSIKNTLLSVQDIARHCGGVYFDPTRAYILNGKPHQHPKVIDIAPWNKKHCAYVLCTINQAPRAQTARTIPVVRRKTKHTTIDQSTDDTAHRNISPQHPIPLSTILPQAPSRRAPRRQQLLQDIHQTGPNHTTPTNSDLSYHDWHLRLNHAQTRAIQLMAARNLLLNMPAALQWNPPTLTCSSCAHSEQKPKPHTATSHKYQLGYYMSSDTCEPINPPSRYENRHFLTIIDTKSGYLTLYFLKKRSEVLSCIHTMLAVLNTHGPRIPAIYRTDNAKEFLSTKAKALYSNYGIEHRTTTPHQPQENSLAERINQTLMQAARANLHHAQLPETYWEDAIRDAAYKYNMMYH